MGSAFFFIERSSASRTSESGVGVWTAGAGAGKSGGSIIILSKGSCEKPLFTALTSFHPPTHSNLQNLWVFSPHTLIAFSFYWKNMMPLHAVASPKTCPQTTWSTSFATAFFFIKPLSQSRHSSHNPLDTPHNLPTTADQTSSRMDLRVGGKYRLGKKIGSGSFGEYHLVFFFSVVPQLWLLLRRYLPGSQHHLGRGSRHQVRVRQSQASPARVWEQSVQDFSRRCWRSLCQMVWHRMRLQCNGLGSPGP